jgi:CHAD domain-containing protein
MPTKRNRADAMSRRSTKANGVAAHPIDLDCAEAFRRIATSCLAEIAANRHGASLGQADAIHRMRVGITRLRSAVSFFSAMTRDEAWPRLKSELRWLNRSLGSARDVDVVAQNIQRPRYRKLTAKGIERDLDRRSKQSRRRLQRALRSSRLQRFVTTASAWIDGGPWATRSDPRSDQQRRQPVGPYCERKIAQWQAKLIHRGSDLADMKESQRHRLRIRAKRLRYMLEMLASVCPERHLGPSGKVTKPIKHLQRSLGDLGDLKRLRDWTKSSMAARREGQPHGYKREKTLVLADAARAYRKMARAFQH